VSLFESALQGLAYVGTWAATEAYAPPRRHNSAHPSIVPFQNFATADGWIVVACPKQKFWERLCETIGRKELAADPRFADFGARDRNREELVPLLEQAFAERTTAEWLRTLAGSDIPAAPVNDVLDALRDPQVEARGAVVEVEHPRLGTVRQVASPLRLGDDAPLRRAPFRGEHTREVLVELCGYEPERVDALAAAGAFGKVAVDTA
jgi:crotonobetainyl-CoA:carnitine CoA-transferase CaiB-like acyl-CoA transferase